MIHVAIMMKRYLDLVLDGTKTVECRLTRQARAPYEAIEPGEKKTVAFELPCARLSLVNPDLRRVVEPGEFELMVGGSSRDEDLLRASFRVRP